MPRRKWGGLAPARKVTSRRDLRRYLLVEEMPARMAAPAEREMLGEIAGARTPGQAVAIAAGCGHALGPFAYWSAAAALLLTASGSGTDGDILALLRGKRRGKDALMTRAEAERFNSLPARIVAWRAIDGRDGFLTLRLSREAEDARARLVGAEKVGSYIVCKSDTAGFLGRRGEDEIIVPDASRIFLQSESPAGDGGALAIPCLWGAGHD